MPEAIRCPFCEGSSSQKVIEENGYAGRQCDRCGLIYVSPRPTRSEMADLYAEGEAYLPPEFFIATSNTVAGRLGSWHNVRTVRRHRSGGSLLEIGPGAGTFLAAARRSGFDVYGVELNAQQAEFIRDQRQIPCVTSLEEARELGPGAFDVVYSRDVLSHLYDPIADMREIGALLRPGGLHIFETGNLGDVAHRHFSKFDVFQYPDHLFFYSERSLGELLARSGFEQLKTYRYSILPELVIKNQIHRVTQRDGRGAASNGQPKTPRKPTLPSRKGLMARDALDLAYFGLRLTLGRVAIRRRDPQTLVVVSRKVS